MTQTEKQKCIAEQMPFELLFLCRGKGIVQDFAFGKKLQHWQDIINSKEKLILRPISDITKEITHKGYNNNQPFIPLVELAKTQYEDFKPESIEIIDDISTICKGYSIKISKRVMSKNEKYNCCYWFHPFSTERTDPERDLLHLWHFDTRNLIESNEAISTDIINPYSK